MMALRYILNHHCVHKLKPHRQFSSSTLISKNLYKSSLPILPTPWLMLPPDVKDGPNGPTDNYLNIIDKSIVKIDRPKAHGSILFNTKCVGSAKGWVAFKWDLDGCLFLANPYTEAHCLKLRACSDFPKYREGLQFTLAGDPMLNNYSLLEEERDSFHRLYLAAYNRKADTVYIFNINDNWHKYSREPENYISLVTRSHFNKENTCIFSLISDPEVLYNKFVCKDSWVHRVEKYLVVAEENNPRLFLVIRHLAKDVDHEVQCETKDINLFEIDLEGDREVKCVESIGDKVLFLGRNSEPFFISSRDYSGLKSNCVYLAEDLGYYDLEMKCITPFLSLGDLPNIRPQVYWVAPPYKPYSV